MHRFAPLLLAAVTLIPAHAARFEVASVKPNHAAGCRGRWDFRVSHGILTAENAPLRRIISRAYGLTDDRVSGPTWLDSECYDVLAKAAEPVPDSEVMDMLRGLLEERFHLVAHRETDERPLFALVIDRGGHKLRAWKDAVPLPATSGDGRILFAVRHMPDLCERLGKVTGRAVVDQTGLTGDYQIVLTYYPFGSAITDPADSSNDIFTAARVQLGLRLEPRKGMLEILKISGIDKVPDRN